MLLTDADIVYEPGMLRTLAARAASGRYVLTSLMAKLRCESLAERAFIPAFVYFFQMLYPFAWVNDPRNRMAAAAGGCMLIRADALARAGGIAVIRDALIDDCSLAAVMKKQGPIWLGLTDRVRSIRDFRGGGRHPHHGVPLGLCPAPLFPGPAGADPDRDGPDLLGAAPAGAVRPWNRPGAGPRGLGADGSLVLANVALLWSNPALGTRPPGHCDRLYGIYLQFRAPAHARKGRTLEGALPGKKSLKKDVMVQSADFRSGKDHRDENFPVASRLVSARHRPAIMAFYDFARAADDIADHPSLPADDKLRQLDRMEASLTGAASDDMLSVRLREQIAERRLSPQHALDLLKAFRQDVTKLRYADWDELIGYCTYSAMPVGRFVLDVHGEDRATWASSDVLCAVLQIVNHLQDCGKDYRALDRVYLPQDCLRAHGATTEALAEPKASPALLACLHELARRTVTYFETQPPLTDEIKDTRLACEVAAIAALAQRLLVVLQGADPLADKVHLSRATLLAVMAGSITKTVARRLLPGGASLRRAQDFRP